MWEKLGRQLVSHLVQVTFKAPPLKFIWAVKIIKNILPFRAGLQVASGNSIFKCK